MSITTGIYKHFKGGKYEVLTLATHHETKEQVVVYQSLEDGKVYIREAAMFSELVEKEGQKIPRYERISDSQNDLESRITLNMTKSIIQLWANEQQEITPTLDALVKILGINTKKTNA